MRSLISGILMLTGAVASAPFARMHSAAKVDVIRTFDSSGAMLTERSYIAGRETGVHRAWFPTGTPRFVYEYRNGVLEGTSREWFPSGALYREQRYAAGHESGLQRMYWQDGRVRASYVVRAGRRFGLMGAKGCVAKGDTLREGRT